MAGVDLRDYFICNEIGRGKYGDVYRCFSFFSHKPFACKAIYKRHSTEIECIQKEPQINRLLLGHPNIVKMYNTYEDDNYLYLIFDLCDAPDLYERIISNKKYGMSEPQANAYFEDLMNAVAYCHRMGVAHRDIKPENVLFDSENNQLKLADFGSAEWFGVNDSKLMSGVAGTPNFMAPEILSGKDYNEKVDVWSCGVILYIMLTGGVPPFDGDSPAEIFDKVLRGDLRFPTRIFRLVSPEAKDLLSKMLCKDPATRLSADEVLRHPWVMNGGQSDISNRIIEYDSTTQVELSKCKSM